MLIQIKLSGLKRAYKKAVDEKKEMFRYKECDFLVSYAKYLIEYFRDEYRKLNLSEDEGISFNTTSKTQDYPLKQLGKYD